VSNLPLTIDLRHASYEDFVTFVFDHYPIPQDDVDELWYWKLEDDVEFDPRRAIAHITRICEESATLLESFTLPQVAQGINYLLGAGNRDGFLDLLWDPKVPWAERYRCIRAIPQLYTQVFERDEDGAGGLAFMLWDSIAYGYFAGTCSPATDPEDARVQEAMFEALSEMLASDHAETLAGAIHGLGHLRHRQSNKAIRDLLSSGRDFDPELRMYAAAVLEDHFQ
jgi:hypothetical protein